MWGRKSCWNFRLVRFICGKTVFRQRDAQPGKEGEKQLETVKKIRPNMAEYAEITAVKRLLQKSNMLLYHGNKNESMIPTYGAGRIDNDYGRGFYTTSDQELAKEWAWGTYTQGNKAYIHTFELDTADLRILDLTELDSIHWIAELLFNRKLNLGDKEVVQDNVKILLEKYKLDTGAHDVIIGYRADDSYFAYAEAFVSGTIYKDTLEKALRTGELGIQVFIKGERAFERLRKVGVNEVPDKYRGYFVKRDRRAREQYNALRVNQGSRGGKQTIYDFILAVEKADRSV